MSMIVNHFISSSNFNYLKMILNLSFPSNNLITPFPLFHVKINLETVLKYFKIFGVQIKVFIVVLKIFSIKFELYHSLDGQDNSIG